MCLASTRLDVLVEVDADEHAEDAEDVDLNIEPKHELDQYKVYSEGRVDARREISREYALNRTLGCHCMENFSQDSTK